MAATDGMAYGLTTLEDYSTEHPFLDLMKQSRPWLKGWDNGWSEIEPYLDANGWPTEMPPGWTVIRNAWDNPDPGPMVVTYTGQGTVTVDGGVTGIVNSAGRIEFTATGATFQVNIDATNPNDNGQYIKYKLFRAEHEDRIDDGEVFNPAFLAVVGNARQLRFMDWMATNGSTIVDWADRPTVDDYSYNGSASYGRTDTAGVPVEHMVALANLLQIDPWFNIPHMASDDFVEQCAEYVRDNLDEGLAANIEYSNEMWNFAPGFLQTGWADDQAEDLWGTTPVDFIPPTNLDYQAMRATQVAKICADVFTAERSRLVNVLGVQNGSSFWLNRQLTRLVWDTYDDPAPVLVPADQFDAVAVSLYFGALDSSQSAATVAYLATHTEEEAFEWMKANLLDDEYTESIPMIAGYWALSKTVATSFGLDLIGYEGGQHIAQSYSGHGLGSGEATMSTFATNFCRSPQMADLYDALWDEWVALPGDGPFMQYLAVGNGSWGILSELGDTNPRYRCVRSRSLGLDYEPPDKIGVKATLA